jgi:hypothetical protein
MENLSALVAQATRREWRELGFYYLCNEQEQAWHLHGSRAGLLTFADRLEDYARSSAHSQPSEHEHLGPYFYLTLTTWPESLIDDRGVWGSSADFQRLATMIREACRSAASRQTYRIRERYTADAAYALLLHFHPDAFDPASLDPQLSLPS